MRSAEEIVVLQNGRELAQGPVLGEMREVGAAFENKLIVPLPELDRNERSSIPNLIQQGITAKAQRVSSVLPNLDYPVVRQGIKASEEASRHRRMANLGWWEFNQMDIVLGRRARHLIGYTTAPVLVEPNFKLGIPKWNALDPLGVFPAPPAVYDEMCRSDVICAYASTVAALKRDYPQAMSWMLGASADTRVKLLKYIDDDEVVMVATGTTDATIDQHANTAVAPIIQPDPYGRSYRFIVELDRQPNRAGRCWAVIPGTISLDKPVNRYAAMIGTHMTAAKLAALELVGIQGGILPKTYFVQTENQGGIVTEATVGHLGHVKGGRLEKLDIEPSMRPDAMADRLERSQRIDGGIPVATSGEAQTGVRTGRLGDSLLSAALDPDLAEDQRLFQRSLQYENEVAVAIDKGYFGNKAKSFHVNWKGAKGQLTYKASELFADGYAPSVVMYPIVGADEQALVVGAGQRIGLGTLSKWEMMGLDPMVRDREFTHDRIIYEGLEAAMLQALQQQAIAGALSPYDLGQIGDLVMENRVELFKAVKTVNEEAQARQASSGPPGTPTGPVAPGSPEAQPGLAAGMPAAAGAAAPAIAPEGPSEQNLMHLLQTARAVRTQARAS